MLLTEKLIRAGLTKGVGLSDGQARSLGIRSRKGWLRALIGTEMSDKDYQKFLLIGEKNRDKRQLNKLLGKEKKKKSKKKKRKKRKSEYKAKSDEFLKSYAWRKLRLVILERYGRKCQCCGATPESGAIIHVDHIKPRKFFPELALEESNLQVLCNECNHGKGNWNESDFRPDDELKARFKEIIGD